MTLFIFQKLMLVLPGWVGPIQIIANAEGGHGKEESGAAALPSAVDFLVKYLGHDFMWAEHWVNVIYALFTSLIMVAVAMRVYKRREMIPGKLQNFVEMLVESMYNFIESILGDNARRYTPFLGTLFFYILINNFWGIIPFGHSPSTSLSVTASLAILVFFYVQYTGIRRLGLKTYGHHLLGAPTDVATWIVSPLLLVIHLIGEFAKPLSLALRLFGNITGEDILVAAFVGLGISVLAFAHSPVGIPLHVPFILLGMLLSTIQALVFTLLSTIYILMMLPHEEHA